MAKPIRAGGARQGIILAARRLVARQGVHATTMRGIAVEAGVTTGALTHHFADKADLMTSVLRYNNHLIVRRITEAVVDRRGIAAIQATAECLLPFDDESLAIWTVLIAFWGHAPAQRFVVTEGDALGYLALRTWMVRLLNDAIADGDARRDVDVELEAERLLVMIGGVGLMVGGFPEQVESARGRARKLLADILRQLSSATAPTA